MSHSVQVPASTFRYGKSYDPDVSFGGDGTAGQWGWFWGTNNQWNRMNLWMWFDWTNFRNLNLPFHQITAINLTVELSGGASSDAIWTSINIVKPAIFPNFPPSWNYSNTPLQISWNVPGGMGMDTDIREVMVLRKFTTAGPHTFSLPLEQMRYIIDYSSSNAFIFYCPYQPGTTGQYLYMVPSNIGSFVYLTIHYNPSLAGDAIIF